MSLQIGGDVGVMMLLGPYPFGVSTAAYQNLKRQTEHRWAAQDRFGQREALQYLGPGPDTISLDGYILPHYKGGQAQVSAMRAMASLGTPQTLLSGLGQLLGLWVVESVEEGQSVFQAGGAPRRQDFTVRLRRYDSDLLPEIEVPGTGLEAGGLLSGALGPQELLGDFIDRINATESAAANATAADAVSQSSALADVAAAFTNGVTTVQKAITESTAGKLIAASVPAVNGLVNTAQSIARAGGAIKAAGNNPTSLISAVTSLSSATATVSNAFGQTASSVLSIAGLADGASATTLFSQQTTEAARSIQALSTTAGSLKNASDRLRGLL